MISILITTKEHHSVKNYVELLFLFSAHHLMMLYICTMFCKNILNDMELKFLFSAHYLIML